MTTAVFGTNISKTTVVANHTTVVALVWELCHEVVRFKMTISCRLKYQRDRIKMRNLVCVVTLTLITGVFLVIPPGALACECPDTGVPPPCARFWRSNIVFTALVTQIDHAPDKAGVYPENTRVRLKVLKVFKGVIAEDILDAQGHEIDCQGVYENGQQYLIYADRYDKAESMVRTTPCFGRAKITDSAQDLVHPLKASTRITVGSMKRLFSFTVRNISITLSLRLSLLLTRLKRRSSTQESIPSIRYYFSTCSRDS
jgi:hypothetical protein